MLGGFTLKQMKRVSQKEECEVLLRHPFSLKSAYQKQEKAGMVTNFKQQFRECLDYIWYESDRLSLQRIHPVPRVKDLAR